MKPDEVPNDMENNSEARNQVRVDVPKPSGKTNMHTEEEMKQLYADITSGDANPIEPDVTALNINTTIPQVILNQKKKMISLQNGAKYLIGDGNILAITKYYCIGLTVSDVESEVNYILLEMSFNEAGELLVRESDDSDIIDKVLKSNISSNTSEPTIH
jgi:hypothetical protein